MTINQNYQIMVPSNKTDGTPTIIHWSEPSLQSFKENVQSNGNWTELLKIDPQCRVWSPSIGWTDAWLSEIMSGKIMMED